MDNQVDEKQGQKIAKFESRMNVVERDNEDLAKACRSVHSMLSLAKTVAESVFNDDVADQPEVVMQISAAIADEIEEMNARKHAEEFEDDDGGEIGA